MLRAALLAATIAAVVVFAGGTAAAADGPMADAGLDQSVTVETTVHLDGTGSGHPDGALSGYEWTIRTPDGRVTEPACADCERTRFTPTTVGRYEVTLTVTGPDGAESTDTLYVYVDDAGPEVSLSGDQTPDPNEPVTYTATAESPDAELEEIAWAVEDQIVAVRSLDGTTDESQLSLAFAQPRTHRVQVVVRDSNGRTAYDQLYVRPSSKSVEPTDWSDVEPPDCSDPGYAARNSEECWDIEVSETSPSQESESEETPTFDPEEITYQTDGYRVDMNLGQGQVDSSFMNVRARELGIGNRESSRWYSDPGGVLQSTVEGASTVLFGQERKTVKCEMTVGEISNSGCQQKVLELENRGETSNAYSRTNTGAYSEYGLQNAKRVRGQDPNSLQAGRKVEITIVIQQAEDGVIERTAEELEPAANRVKEAATSITRTGNSKSRSDPTHQGSVSTTTSSSDAGTDGSVSSGRGGYLSSSSMRSSSTSTSNDANPGSGNSTVGNSNPDRGLKA